jgi:hypothetical protein
MADFLWGISPTTVDTVAQYTLGTESRDPRTRDFPQNIIRYVKSNANILVNASLTKDLTDETNEPHAVLATTATGQPMEGIAHVAIASGSFGWVTIKGKATNSITAAVTAGALLGSTATAGRLTTVATSGAETVAAQQGVRISTIDSSAGSGLVDVVINM